MSTGRWATMSPASASAVMWCSVTPVSRSPFTSAQLTGAPGHAVHARQRRDRLDPAALIRVVRVRDDDPHLLAPVEERRERAGAEGVVGEERPARHQSSTSLTT